ncbi:putative bifunctional diguanylate cyclase/phosphodiesterase [Agrobacterium rosae]|uniref:Sensor domain-containing phosphodiesterase n=1 Tax=Agrobacterium rosae TaxID=1972867 RepID=A0AAW9FRU2_9HYPH|nr:sensor domain-containing phosphodiesterase [Agrobacterium rosae]MDX8305891.1 sensor domain-containing phosphodiesterase [Agrobacterium rosae]
MQTTLIEAERLKAVADLALMDDERGQEAYDRIARLAKHIFTTDVAAITFIDDKRQWFKSHIGIDLTENAREDAFCDITIRERETVVIEDTTADPRSSKNIFVVNDPAVRFYAGQPLMTDGGHAVGTLCLFDTRPRAVSDEERKILKDLAAMVMAQIKRDRDLAYVDPLTKLPNRLQFLSDLEDRLRAEDAGPVTVALIELMDLTEAAEAVRAFGIGFFNQQIKQAAAAIYRALPRTVLYQVGAFHLGLYIDGSTDRTSPEFQTVAQGIAEPFTTSIGIPVTLRPCIGLRSIKGDDTEISDVLRSLLSALKDARSADETFAIYDGASDDAHKRSFQLLTDFAAALKVPDQLRLVFQPRVNLSSGLSNSVEALLRWQHPVLGPISPAELFPIIEKTALVRQTTEWVMEATVSAVADWLSGGLHLRCSFNISARNLEEDDFVDRLSVLLSRYRVPATLVEIEIVEDAALGTSDRVRERLHEIASLGVALAIDDFGSGYSNLSYLLSLPATYLKIDRSLASQIISEPKYATVVSSVVTMAHQLNYRIVAEGVETADVCDMLRMMGCDEVQGYYFSRPLEAGILFEWVKNCNLSASSLAS